MKSLKPICNVAVVLIIGILLAMALPLGTFDS